MGIAMGTILVAQGGQGLGNIGRGIPPKDGTDGLLRHDADFRMGRKGEDHSKKEDEPSHAAL